jgi:predicted dehydrogenase
VTTTALNIGVIGLGVMGQRMLERLDAHPRLQAAGVWDADADAVQRTLHRYPRLQPAADAAALIARAGLHGLYIATPPAAHLSLSEAAFDAGLAVLCEKPLTVDFGAAQRTLARIEREAGRAAVNFSLASSPGLAVLQQAFGAAGDGRCGRLQSVQIDLAFSAWPRAWQAQAGAWLSQRGEGGFAREVLSHFVFVLQRVLGPATVQRSAVTYPGDGVGAETALSAQLRVGEVVVDINGRVDAALDTPDHNRMRWCGSAAQIELSEWFGLRQRVGEAEWVPLGDAAAHRAAGQAAQLEQWERLLEGRPHGLPGYAEALAVQQTIEALLAGR